MSQCEHCGSVGFGHRTGCSTLPEETRWQCQCCGAQFGYLHLSSCADQNVVRFPFGSVVGAGHLSPSSTEERDVMVEKARCVECKYVDGHHKNGCVARHSRGPVM